MFIALKQQYNKLLLLLLLLNAVSIATGYGLDDEMVGVPVPVGARIFTSPCGP
jgi:hypothetical protein